MSETVKIAFAPFSAPDKGTLGRLRRRRSQDRAKAPPAHVAASDSFLRSRRRDARLQGQGDERHGFRAPAGLSVERLLVVGVAPKGEDKPIDFVHLGGYVAGKLARPRSCRCSSRRPTASWSAAAASEFALGYRLRNYKFDKYKTKKGERGRSRRRP